MPLYSASFREAKFRKNRIYYYGHKGSQILDELPLSNTYSTIPMLCLSKNRTYAMQYATIDDEIVGHVYVVRITRDYNLINLHYDKDMDYFRNAMPHFSDADFRALKTDDWLHYRVEKLTAQTLNTAIQKRDVLIDKCFDMGFEGFYNYEADEKYPSICIFSTDGVEIVGVQSAEEMRADANRIRESFEWIQDISLLDPNNFARRRVQNCVKAFNAGVYVPNLKDIPV